MTERKPLNRRNVFDWHFQVSVGIPYSLVSPLGYFTTADFNLRVFAVTTSFILLASLLAGYLKLKRIQA